VRFGEASISELRSLRNVPERPQAVRAPTLAEALTRLLETEWLYDEHERRRLAAREEAPRGETHDD
jgi:hypothetical protein